MNGFSNTWAVLPGQGLYHDPEFIFKGPDGGVIKFDIDPFRKHCLLNGLDDIGLTLEKQDAITAYESKLAESRPWA